MSEHQKLFKRGCLFFGLFLSLCSCQSDPFPRKSWSQSQTTEKGVSYGYSQSGKKANAEFFGWAMDPQDTAITIPSTLENGYTVTDIGAYEPTKVTEFAGSLFGVEVSSNKAGWVEYGHEQGSGLSGTPARIKKDYGTKNASLNVITFTLSIPSTVNNIVCLGADIFWLFASADNTQKAVYLTNFVCTVDPANETYYSESGVVYKRSDKSRVDGYYQADTDMTFPKE